ncbi:MAG: DUF998 domain-containing protein [Euryarchaeota archaeon]|nr:DUF998 domain-containing protein [Euryarchaeota archaeon]MDE1837303.1 DUF998 domain-containing protein [Euryarchaeota archaeon]MDE1879825.1 DUF998 domain-containing protein [Euryarchaeota archaeon]MDE2045266.1 DUF998 domain-containing protein [Thermoplasmata archaeon]
MGDRTLGPFGTPNAEAVADERPAEPSWKSLRIRLGALALVVGGVQFFIAMAVEQALRPGYLAVGPGSNTISDLGVNGNHVFNGTSYYWGYDWIFNGSVMVLGILAVFGIVALYQVFPRNGRTYPAAWLLTLGSLGAVCIGIFTESSTAMGGQAHDFFSVWTFGWANLGLTAMGIAMWGDRSWGRYALVTLGLGVLSVVALAFYIQNILTHGAFFGLGEGGLERVVAFPVLLWAIAVGLLALYRGRAAVVSKPEPTVAPSSTS